jgi:Fungal Zn(2)-Cys(6) binuclear cluster domain
MVGKYGNMKNTDNTSTDLSPPSLSTQHGGDTTSTHSQRKPTCKYYPFSTRAAAACESCRKLKIKCRGGIPCDKCIKLGIQSSCVLHQRKSQRQQLPTNVVPPPRLSIPVQSVQPVPGVMLQSLAAPPQIEYHNQWQALLSNTGSCPYPQDSQLPQPGVGMAHVPLTHVWQPQMSPPGPPAPPAPPAPLAPPQPTLSGPIPLGPHYHTGSQASPPPPPPPPERQYFLSQKQHLPVVGSTNQQPAWAYYQHPYSVGYVSSNLQPQVASFGRHPMQYVQAPAQTQMPEVPTPLSVQDEKKIGSEALAYRTNDHGATFAVNSHNADSVIQLSQVCRQNRMLESLRTSAMQLCGADSPSKGLLQNPCICDDLSDSLDGAQASSPDSAASSRPVESRALIASPRRSSNPQTASPTFMLFHAPTIRQRIAHVEAAAQLVYDSCMTAQQSADVFRTFNEGMRVSFEDLLASSQADATQLERRDTTALTDTRRADFKQFMLGVVYMAMRDSLQEAALARKAHKAMMRRVQGALAVLELRKAALNKVPICVISKATYPDWTKGDMWINRRAMDVFRIDPNSCPNQMIPVATFMQLVSHPATYDFASSHAGFSIANNRSNASHYRVYTRTDGTLVAGMHANHYLLGPAPLHRPYLTYVFFQPLPIQPLDMEDWARRVMVNHREAKRRCYRRGAEADHSTIPSARYPGVMHALIQEYIQSHPEDLMRIPPIPNHKCQIETTTVAAAAAAAIYGTSSNIT